MPLSIWFRAAMELFAEKDPSYLAES
jgi:hypothetical protein